MKPSFPAIETAGLPEDIRKKLAEPARLGLEQLRSFMLGNVAFENLRLALVTLGNTTLGQAPLTSGVEYAQALPSFGMPKGFLPLYATDTNGIAIAVGLPKLNKARADERVGLTFFQDMLNGAGDIGERVRSSVASGSALALTNATPKTITSITVGPGTWLISGVGGFTGAPTGVGNVGDAVRSSVASAGAVTLVTATPKTITSITLPAGTWAISAVGMFTGSPTGTASTIGVSTATNAFTGSVFGESELQTPTVSTASTDLGLPVPTFYVSPGVSTTYFLVAQGNFSAGTYKAYGTINACRVVSAPATASTVGISTATNAFTGTVFGESEIQSPTVATSGDDLCLTIPPVLYTPSATTTYFLVGQGNFAGGSYSAYGTIDAYRIQRVANKMIVTGIMWAG